MKKINLISGILTCLSLLPISLNNIINDKTTTNISRIENKNIYNNLEINLKNNDINYENLIKNNFDIKYSNFLHSGSISYNSDLLIYTKNINYSKNLIFNKSFSTIDGDKKLLPLDEFIDGNVQIVNNSYIMEHKEIKREFKYLKKCGQIHKIFRVCSNKNHLHNRGCTKIYYEECTGCLLTNEMIGYNLNYSQNDFNEFLQSHTIDNNSFNFSSLLSIDGEKSKKFINRNVLDFKFNFEYLKYSIINSYNKYFLDLFIGDYFGKISENLFVSLFDAINKNKIMDYKNPIMNWLGINDKNYKKENNIWYWIEAINYKDENEIIKMLNELTNNNLLIQEKINNHTFTSKKLWLHLYNILNDVNILKNINYKISYKLGNQNDIKIKVINLFDLINKKNSFLSNYYDSLNFNHTFENEKIIILNISINSEYENFYLEHNDADLIVFDQDNNYFIKKPYLNDENSWFIYNPEIIDKNIISLSNADQIVIQNFLYQNNFDNILPSELIKWKKFKNSVLNIKFSPFFKIEDNDLLEWIKNDNTTLESPYFDFYINKIEMTAFDFDGKILVEIFTTDNQKLEIKLNNLKKQSIKAKVITDKIYLSSLNLVNLKDIDKNYIINNLIGFENNVNANTLISFNLTKEIFLSLSFVDLDLQFTDKWLKINIKYIDNENGNLYNSEHIIENNIKNNENQNIGENEIISNPPKNNINGFIIIGISTFFSLLVLFIILFLIIKIIGKNKKWK